MAQLKDTPRVERHDFTMYLSGDGMDCFYRRRGFEIGYFLP